MPYIAESTYSPPLLFKNSYVNTIYTSVYRKAPRPDYIRKRIFTPDGDFMDLDWAYVKNSDSLVIVLHGLEGSSESQYAKGISSYFNKKGCNALVINHRSCSGENNRLPQSYHMGWTRDLDYIINGILQENKYNNIFLTGFSLGGNIVLKYVGEKGSDLPTLIRAAVAFSVPVHIHSANIAISHRKNKPYLKHFMDTMTAKAKEKMVRLGSDYPQYKNFKPRSFNEFDELITAPVHGFRSAEHYWESCSSVQFLSSIRIPTLLINAQDDTFLSEQCYPKDIAMHHPYFYFEMPRYGGHCGFYSRNKNGFTWFEKRAFDFMFQYKHTEQLVLEAI